MRKYLEIGIISLKQEFAYRLNFIMWRVRNILQILLVFFLWDSIYSDPDRLIFGYDKSKMMTYVFGILLVRAFVLSAKSMEVAGEISRGDVSNYFIKPVNYFKYWFSRDIASKVLNMVFAILEVFVLSLLFKPQFFIQTNLSILIFFLITLILAVIIYFLLLLIVSCLPFWSPEVAWSGHFLVTIVILEFASGALFPLDVLPSIFQKFLYLTPFPTLIFMPIQIYLGKITGIYLIKSLLIPAIWVVLLYFLLNILWKKGLKVYEAYGK